jgi:hypothetical protein
VCSRPQPSRILSQSLYLSGRDDHPAASTLQPPAGSLCYQIAGSTRFCANPICPRNMTPVSFVLDWRVAWCKTRPWKDLEYISSHWRKDCATCFPDAAQSKATLEFPNRYRVHWTIYVSPRLRLGPGGWELQPHLSIDRIVWTIYLHKWSRPAII